MKLRDQEVGLFIAGVEQLYRWLREHGIEDDVTVEVPEQVYLALNHALDSLAPIPSVGRADQIRMLGQIVIVARPLARTV